MGVKVIGKHPNFNNDIKGFRMGRKQAAQMAGQILVRGAHKEVLEGAKSGNHYASLPNRSSAAGESPANQSGQYLNAFDYEVDGGATQLEFGNSAEHAIYLEEGTSKMDARPGLKNTVEASSGNVRQILETIPFKKITG